METAFWGVGRNKARLLHTAELAELSSRVSQKAFQRPDFFHVVLPQYPRWGSHSVAADFIGGDLESGSRVEDPKSPGGDRGNGRAWAKLPLLVRIKSRLA